MPILRKLGFGLWRRTSKANASNGYYTALKATWTNKPDATVDAAMNTFFDKLQGKEGGTNFLDNKFDAAWWFGIHTNDDGEALKNIINPGSNDATEVNAPYFNQFSGFKGDAVSKYINTNWTPSIDGDIYKLNVASFGLYGLDKVTIGNKINGNSGGVGLYAYYAGLRRRGTINQFSYVNGGIMSDARKLLCVTRDNSTSLNLYGEGVYENLPSQSTILPTASLWLLGWNSAGYYSDERIGFSFVGASLTESECQELETILNWWFNFEWLSLGAELINDPSFDDASKWAWQTSTWQVTGGQAQFLDLGTGNFYNKAMYLEENKYYLLEFEAEAAGGEFSIWGAGATVYGTADMSGGLQRLVFQAKGNNIMFFRGVVSGSAFNLDSISVKEIIGL